MKEQDVYKIQSSPSEIRRLGNVLYFGEACLNAKKILYIEKYDCDGAFSILITMEREEACFMVQYESEHDRNLAFDELCKEWGSTV